MDTPKRSLLKALVWEATGFLTLFIVGMLTVGGNTKEIGWMTLVFYSIRFLMFVGHEQLWTRIKWGKISDDIDDR